MTRRPGSITARSPTLAPCRTSGSASLRACHDLALLLSAGGPGKGGSTVSDSDGSESGDPSTTMVTTAATTTTTSTSVPTTAGVTEDTAASCEQFAHDPIGPSGMLTIRHQGSEPVWAPAATCAGTPMPRLLDSELDDHFFIGSNCSPTQCEEFMQIDDCQLACDDCATPSLVRIDPGAAYTIHWPGVRASRWR